MSEALEFQDVLKKVTEINQKLRDKGFQCEDIDNFWSRIIKLIPK